jgi:uncharacterized protein (TIGR03790 family)
MLAPLLLALLLAPQPSPDAKRVMVIMNQASQDSMKIGNYYVAKRGIPKENILLLDVEAAEYISGRVVDQTILPAVRAFLAKTKHPIDFAVTTKGVPIKFWRNVSLDGAIAAIDLGLPRVADLAQARGNVNPYFGKDEPFRRAKYRMLLVTRLDGPSVADCLRLVDNALAAKPAKGPFLFDEAPNRTRGGYLELQKTMAVTSQALRAKGFETILDQSPDFASPAVPLMGYVSWGSNDSSFNEGAYRKLRFKPGAIAETFVSTSARTLLGRMDNGQSVISDLIAGGVTGVKGYVSEPYTEALARPNILFDRYVRGYNLAESFYMASPMAAWKDLVIGDPLCRPYR